MTSRPSVDRLATLYLLIKGFNATFLKSHVKTKLLPSFFQVNQVQDDAARLQKAYAGEKADDIHRSEHAVTSAWEGLLEAGQTRRLLLLDTVEKFRFFNMVRDLMLWMDGVNLQIDAHDSPR